MQTMRWGIHYGKEARSQAINARSENIAEGAGMWKKFRGKNRCVVVCQGYYVLFSPPHHMVNARRRYYEWQTKGKDKLPHFTKHSDGKVMLMAGLYDETIDKSIAFPLLLLGYGNVTFVPGQSQPTYTFAIVTTDASKAMSWLHDRQPVIFSTEDEISQWLDTSSQAWSPDLARLLHPWEDTKAPLQWYIPRPCQLLSCSLRLSYQVPKEVGKVGTESPKFIEPIANRKDGIMTMFAKQKSKQIESSAKRKRSPSLQPSSEKAFKTEEHEEKKLKFA